MSPTVSFVIPARDAAATLPACLDAIEAASAGTSGTEILVLDNGSMDDTAALARERRVRVVSAPGRTVAGLRNLGAVLASGDLIAYVDADCVVDVGWLDSALWRFDDPRVAAVGAPTLAPAGSGWVPRLWALHRHRRNVAGPVAWLATENLLIRRTALLEIGGFNERLETCEDVDLCYRLRAHYKLINEPRLRAVHLGEARTLARFFAKEVWRGRGNLRGFLAHPFEPSELPSLLLPLYYLLGGGALMASLGYALWTGQPLVAFLAALVVTGPAIVGALATALSAGAPGDWPRLAVLYLTYAVARAIALLSLGPSWRAPSRDDATAVGAIRG